MTAHPTRPLGVPVTIPQAIITRAVAYCRRGYTAEEVAKICGLNLSHARLIKLSGIEQR